jgi:hypothetical protein
LEEGLEGSELTNSHLHAIKTNNAPSIYWMTGELQSTLEASRIEWPAL